jgi:hypothetical protein
MSVSAKHLKTTNCFTGRLKQNTITTAVKVVWSSDQGFSWGCTWPTKGGVHAHKCNCCQILTIRSRVVSFSPKATTTPQLSQSQEFWKLCQGGILEQLGRTAAFTLDNNTTHAHRKPAAAAMLNGEQLWEASCVAHLHAHKHDEVRIWRNNKFASFLLLARQ